MDVRLESHVAMLGELQEFYKRRSEVELEYSRGMDKLVKQIMTRHKADKQRYVTYPWRRLPELTAALIGCFGQGQSGRQYNCVIFVIEIANEIVSKVARRLFD